MGAVAWGPLDLSLLEQNHHFRSSDKNDEDVSVLVCYAQGSVSIPRLRQDGKRSLLPLNCTHPVLSLSNRQLGSGRETLKICSSQEEIALTGSGGAREPCVFAYTDGENKTLGGRVTI